MGRDSCILRRLTAAVYGGHSETVSTYRSMKDEDGYTLHATPAMPRKPQKRTHLQAWRHTYLQTWVEQPVQG